MRSWDQHVRMEQDSPFRGLEWRAIGPKQAGARIEAIAVPPGNHGTIYVGIGSGNLWKTVNNGVTWTPIFENESTFTIGDIAVSASNPDIVFLAGFGESLATLSGRDGWDTMSAVASGTVVLLDYDTASRWGPRVVELLRAIAEGAAMARGE